MEKWFQDLNSIKYIFDLHNFPLTCDISNLDDLVREELIFLRNDLNIPFETGKNLLGLNWGL